MKQERCGVMSVRDSRRWKIGVEKVVGSSVFYLVRQVAGRVLGGLIRVTKFTRHDGNIGIRA